MYNKFDKNKIVIKLRVLFVKFYLIEIFYF